MAAPKAMTRVISRAGVLVMPPPRPNTTSVLNRHSRRRQRHDAPTVRPRHVRSADTASHGHAALHPPGIPHLPGGRLPALQGRSQVIVDDPMSVEFAGAAYAKRYGRVVVLYEQDDHAYLVMYDQFVADKARTRYLGTDGTWHEYKGLDGPVDIMIVEP